MTMTFRARIMSAGLWTAGGFAAQKVFQLGSNLVLTRLLFPEAFGLMALANVVLMALQMFSDVGIKPAIIQNDRGEEEAFLNTAWTIQIVRGFVLWVGACAFAYPAALIYRADVLWPLISVLGATAAINGFSSISLATAERRMLVQRLTLVQLCGQAVSLTITAVMAWVLHSVWALAFGGIAGALVAVAFSHLFMPPHRHRLLWEQAAAQSIVRFGRWIFLSTAMTFAAGQGLRALQGVLMTPPQLGVLSVAQAMAAMPSDLMLQIVMLVVFPALSESRKNGHAAMVNTLGKLQLRLLALALAGFAGLALISLPLIEIMYDARYTAAGPQLAMLVLSGAIGVIPLPYQNAVLAMGDTRLHTGFMIVNMAGRIIGMFAGFHLGGITGMLLGIAAGAVAGYLFVAFHARRLGLISWPIDLGAFAAVGLGTAATVAIYGPGTFQV